jgi:hypothetical protein
VRTEKYEQRFNPKKPEAKRQLGSYRSRWDDIKVHLTHIQCNAVDRFSWVGSSEHDIEPCDAKKGEECFYFSVQWEVAIVLAVMQDSYTEKIGDDGKCMRSDTFRY